MRDFRQLQVWEKSHQLAVATYRATTIFPKEEVYGLTNQIRRASIPIPSNIAEGCGRGGEAELARFMQISMGSASELEYQFIIARELGYLDIATYEDLLNRVVEVKRMLAPFIKKLHSAR